MDASAPLFVFVSVVVVVVAVVRLCLDGMVGVLFLFFLVRSRCKTGSIGQ